MTKSSHEGDRTAIALVEPHDGRIESLVLPAAGPGRVDFSHLAVYREVGKERYEIWSYRAALEIGGIHRVDGGDAAVAKERIIDAIAVIDGREVEDWRDLLDRRAVTEIRFSSGSGETRIFCADAQLVLQEAVRLVEEWNGPLVS